MTNSELGEHWRELLAPLFPNSAKIEHAFVRGAWLLFWEWSAEVRRGITINVQSDAVEQYIAADGNVREACDLRLAREVRDYLSGGSLKPGNELLIRADFLGAS